MQRNKSTQNLHLLNFNKTKENNDHNTQDDLDNKEYSHDANEIVNRQQQDKEDIQIKQPNRINANGNNQTMDLSPELLIRYIQEPQVNQKILDALLSTLYGQSDFQICISNLDNFTYQQLQKALHESPQLEYTTLFNNEENESEKESLNNSEILEEQIIKINKSQENNTDDEMKDEFIVNIYGQSQNNVCQQTRWLLLNQKYFMQFQQTANEINLRITPVAQRYQYKLVSESYNQFDQKIFKNRKKFQVQFQEDLDSMVILTYQCQNNEEAKQISRIQTDEIVMKQFYDAFETNNVIIDQIQSNEIQQYQFELIYAVFYNYFDIPIYQLQELFNKIIMNFKKRTLGHQCVSKAKQSESSEIKDFFKETETTIKFNHDEKQQHEICLPKIENNYKIQQINQDDKQEQIIKNIISDREEYRKDEQVDQGMKISKKYPQPQNSQNHRLPRIKSNQNKQIQ